MDGKEKILCVLEALDNAKCRNNGARTRLCDMSVECGEERLYLEDFNFGELYEWLGTADVKAVR